MSNQDNSSQQGRLGRPSVCQRERREPKPARLTLRLAQSDYSHRHVPTFTLKRGPLPGSTRDRLSPDQAKNRRMVLPTGFLAHPMTPADRSSNKYLWKSSVTLTTRTADVPIQSGYTGTASFAPCRNDGGSFGGAPMIMPKIASGHRFARSKKAGGVIVYAPSTYRLSPFRQELFHPERDFR